MKEKVERMSRLKRELKERIGGETVQKKPVERGE